MTGTFKYPTLTQKYEGVFLKRFDLINISKAGWLYVALLQKHFKDSNSELCKGNCPFVKNGYTNRQIEKQRGRKRLGDAPIENLCIEEILNQYSGFLEVLLLPPSKALKEGK